MLNLLKYQCVIWWINEGKRCFSFTITGENCGWPPLHSERSGLRKGATRLPSTCFVYCVYFTTLKGFFHSRIIWLTGLHLTAQHEFRAFVNTVVKWMNMEQGAAENCVCVQSKAKSVAKYESCDWVISFCISLCDSVKTKKRHSWLTWVCHL